MSASLSCTTALHVPTVHQKLRNIKMPRDCIQPRMQIADLPNESCR